MRDNTLRAASERVHDSHPRGDGEEFWIALMRVPIRQLRPTRRRSTARSSRSKRSSRATSVRMDEARVPTELMTVRYRNELFSQMQSDKLLITLAQQTVDQPYQRDAGLYEWRCSGV
jgi:hypothetical protein